ncbi:MAG: hypothetical protein KDA47_12475 [Planctomycetales bacterium]|nr:hypothetical protein [Planctomycetales bacterium]
MVDELLLEELGDQDDDELLEEDEPGNELELEEPGSSEDELLDEDAITIPFRFR